MMENSLMTMVHPAFDPITMTWFVPERDDIPDVRYLADLQARMPHVQIVDYRPIRSCDVIAPNAFQHRETKAVFARGNPKKATPPADVVAIARAIELKARAEQEEQQRRAEQQRLLELRRMKMIADAARYQEQKAAAEAKALVAAELAAFKKQMSKGREERLRLRATRVKTGTINLTATRWTAEELATFDAMIARGVEPCHIRVAMGKTRGQISGQINRRVRGYRKGGRNYKRMSRRGE
jgi:hypothetical protein